MKQHGGSLSCIPIMLLLLTISIIFLIEVEAKGWVVAAEYGETNCTLLYFYVMYPIGVCSVSSYKSSIFWSLGDDGTLVENLCSSSDCCMYYI